MPFEFAELDSRAENDPVSLIEDFLNQLESLLKNIIRGTVGNFDGTVGKFDFKPDLGGELELMEVAFVDAVERGFFRRAKEGLPEARASLGDAGLEGRSLWAKFRFLEALSGQLGAGIRKALKYILDWVNAILGSIKSALGAAGIVVDGIAELKDMVKAKIDLANGW